MNGDLSKARILVRWPEWLKPPWWRVAYLIPPFLGKELSELVQAPVSEKFNNVIETHTRALIEKGIEPPREIANAIYNIADDLQHGREATIKTGDYIAIQNYVKRT